MMPVLVEFVMMMEIGSPLGESLQSGPPLPHGRTGRDDQGHFQLHRSTSRNRWEVTLRAEGQSLSLFNTHQILAQGFLESSRASVTIATQAKLRGSRLRPLLNGRAR